MPLAVLLIGCFDSKNQEYAFLHRTLKNKGINLTCVNIGLLPLDQSKSDVMVHVTPDQLLEKRGKTLDQIREWDDRGKALEEMSCAAEAWVKERFEKIPFDGILGCGGTGGTSVIAKVMRSLPARVAKVCISTAAATDCSAYVEGSNLVMFPSLVDLTGKLNKISRRQLKMGAGALRGMMESYSQIEEEEEEGEEEGDSKEDKPIVLASMFGNTTKCVTRCQEILEGKGYESLVFHAIGSGGKTMEALASDSPLPRGVLDLTTTELADHVAHGVFSAGPDRLFSPGRSGVPHVVSFGCCDMVNFHSLSSVPSTLREDPSRVFYQWNPCVTLMRTNKEDLEEMAKWFIRAAEQATGPIAFLIPLRGMSLLSIEGGIFHKPELDQHFYSLIKKGMPSHVPVVEMDNAINDEAFSEKASAMLIEMMEKHHSATKTASSSPSLSPSPFNGLIKPTPPAEGSNRHSLVTKLRQCVAKGNAIIGAGAGTGISAKFEEAGGADLIIIYNSGRFRMAGLGSLSGMMPFKDANGLLIEMGKEILGRVKHTPILAGVCGTDPFRSIPKFLDKLKKMGFAGVQNFPTVGLIDGNFRLNLEETGMSYAQEIDLIKQASEKDLLTTPYAFDEKDAKLMAQYCDVLVCHMGLTSSGSIGAKTVLSLEESAWKVQRMADAAKTINPDILVLCHGGPISSPDDATFVLSNTTGVDGFYGASSAERLPTERAITDQLAAFKSIKLNNKD